MLLVFSISQKGKRVWGFSFRHYFSGHVMVQSVDQGGVEQEKYHKILSLLSENEQGRNFLDSLTSGKISGNEVALKAQIYLLQQKLGAVNSRAPQESGTEQERCHEILMAFFEVVEQDLANRQKLVLSLQQISETLLTTAEQLKSNGEHSIAGHILEDMAERLVQLRGDGLQSAKATDMALEQLQEVTRYFSDLPAQTSQKKSSSEKRPLPKKTVLKTGQKKFI